MLTQPWNALCHCVDRTPLGTLSQQPLICSSCGQRYTQENGVWCFLSDEQQATFSCFLDEYTKIRHLEGRGSQDPQFYLALPEVDSQVALAGQWRMRAISFNYLKAQILPNVGSSLKVLDLGAGVGWLSHRLHELGHSPCAIDLSMDELDGLGAATVYPGDWPRLQAAFDHLPLADQQADLLIYNASFHYSSDYDITLKEALRVLKPEGSVVILDTPLYRHAYSGVQMKAERHDYFEKKYGFRSDALPSIDYLTWDRLQELGISHGLDWSVTIPWYGWQWKLRPLKAFIKRQREPSKFATLMGRRKP